jgi:hypothetical protein
VDWLYRDLDRVRKSWEDAQAGRYDFHFQIGHPFGVPDFIYAGEVALGVVLADPSGEITALQQAGTPDAGSSTRRTQLRLLVGCQGHPPALQCGHRESWPISVPPQAS